MKTLLRVAIGFVVLAVLIKGFYFVQTELLQRGLSGRILFTGSITQFNGQQPALGLYDLNTRKTQVFKTDGYVTDNPKLTPDGKKIVYRLDDAIFIRPIEAGVAELLFEKSDIYSYSMPSWASDGSKMVFIKGPKSEFGNIYLRSFPDKTDTKLVDSEISPHCVSISPNGEKVAFLGHDPREIERKIVLHRLYVLDLKTNTTVNLNFIPDVLYYRWSPDSKKICYISKVDNQIHIVNADGRNDTKITNFKRMGWSCGFSPDGQKIIFDYIQPFGPTTPDETYIINTDGTGLKRIYPKGNWSSVASPSWYE